MRILVVGGTRYFGIPMVNALLAKGHDVTIATRGNAKVEFNGNVCWATLDRTDAVSVKKALGGQKFDLIIDKIAYGSNDVKALLENVSCDRYIQMSSCSVYNKEHEDIKEDEFATEDYPLVWADRLEDYPTTKRNAERAALEYMKPEDCVFVRYPIVFGENDYTKRLCFYVEHINDGKAMNVDDLEMGTTFINENEAGDFIAYLADHHVSGAINGCSNGTVRVSEIISYIEEKLGKKAVIDEKGDAAPLNGLLDTMSFSTEKAENAGYRFSDLNSWFYKLIDHEIQKVEDKTVLLDLEDNEWPLTSIDHDRMIARAIVVDDEDNFYFVRANRDDDFGKATLIETAGGGVEPGEDLNTAIRRELKEELGVNVEVISKIGVVSDYYNLIHRHNINNYYLCKIISFGDKHLTKDEIEDFHLSTLKLKYEEALAEYEKCRCTKLGRLVANREVPVLKRAKELL